MRRSLVLGLGLFFLTHALSNWLPTVLEDHSGFSTTAASNWAAAAGVVSIIATLTIPRRADRERGPKLIRGLLGIVAASLTGILLLPTIVDPIPILALGVRAAIIPIALLMLLDVAEVNAGNAGAANGIWFSVAEIGGVTGPIAIGLLGDSRFGFGGSLALLVGVCLVLIALTRPSSGVAQSA